MSILRIPRCLACVLVLASALSAPGPEAHAGGLYQIVSGHYRECCGFAGNETGYDLPQANQAFVWFTVDPDANASSLAFLAQDARTVFSVNPCPVFGDLDFSFDQGQIFLDRVVFHVDPGPPPLASYWHYTVTNVANRISIDGELGVVQGGCADVPNRFGHTNVVAIPVPPPVIRLTEFPKEGALIMVQGNAGWTDIVEASNDLVIWTPISTNTMPATLCPICPYILVTDTESPKLDRRYYRAVETPGPWPEPSRPSGPR